MLINPQDRIQAIATRYENFKSQHQGDILEMFIKNEVEKEGSGLLFIKKFLCEQLQLSSVDASKLIAKFSIARI